MPSVDILLFREATRQAILRFHDRLVLRGVRVIYVLDEQCSVSILTDYFSQDILFDHHAVMLLKPLHT